MYCMIVLKKIFTKQALTGWLLIVLVSLGSCKKFVDIPPPVNELVSEVVFESDASATAAVTGIYYEMMNPSLTNQFSESGISLFTGMCADELRYYNINARQNEFVLNQITEANHNSISLNYWDRAYKFIYSANLCIEGLNKSTKVSAAIKTRLAQECKFIRAFCFFHLVNLFGDVPLPLSTTYQANAILPRSPVATVYTQIMSDLKEAQGLAAAYPTPEKVRPNKWTVTALLARVYLYQQDWVHAEAEATSIIQSGMYVLVNNLADVFLKNSEEAIWQLLPVSPVFNTAEGNLIIPATNTAASTYILTDDLLNAFETGDQRFTNWVATRMYQGNALYYPFKYKIKSSSTLIEYYTVFRLAEQYLIRAEARAQQDNLTGAKEDLDVIRHRADLLPATADTQETILDAIAQERRVEFFAEWGHRWFDLKRTNRANDVLGALKPATWQATDVLWPIPVEQLRANPRLKQNEGY